MIGCIIIGCFQGFVGNVERGITIGSMEPMVVNTVMFMLTVILRWTIKYGDGEILIVLHQQRIEWMKNE